MVTFTWKVKKLKCFDNFEDKENVVKTVYWICKAEENGVDFEVAGSSPLELSGESFTAFNSLTEQQVLEWCWSSNLKKESIENSAEYGLKGKIRTESVASQNKDVPWS
jgi:hypothetical protein